MTGKINGTQNIAEHYLKAQNNLGTEANIIITI
jgi:hypothetical protein